jgi:hypothetical protein
MAGSVVERRPLRPEIRGVDHDCTSLVAGSGNTPGSRRLVDRSRRHGAVRPPAAEWGARGRQRGTVLSRGQGTALSCRAWSSRGLSCSRGPGGGAPRWTNGSTGPWRPGLSEAGEEVLPRAPPCQASEEALDHAALLRRVGRDELLAEAVVPKGRPEAPTLEDQPILASDHEVAPAGSVSHVHGSALVAPRRAGSAGHRGQPSRAGPMSAIPWISRARRRSGSSARSSLTRGSRATLRAAFSVAGSKRAQLRNSSPSRDW